MKSRIVICQIPLLVPKAPQIIGAAIIWLKLSFRLGRSIKLGSSNWNFHPRPKAKNLIFGKKADGFLIERRGPKPGADCQILLKSHFYSNDHDFHS